MDFEPSERSLFDLIEHSSREVDDAIENLRRATTALHSSCLDLVAWFERGRSPSSRGDAAGRRTGRDRRTGSDRRVSAPVGLAARIMSSTERRHRPDRRAGADRRGSDAFAA